MLTIFSVLTRALGFVFKIYLTKIMTTTELGIYNLTISLYMVLITIVGSSIPLTISKITATNKTNHLEKETKYSVTSSLILVTTLSLFLSLIILMSKPIIIFLIGDEIGYTIIITLLPSIIFTAIYSQIKGYLWGVENFFAVSMVEFVEQVLRIGFCFLFSLTGWISSPIVAVGISLSIACGISATYGIILYFKNGGKFKYKNGYFKNIIKSSLPLTAIRIFSSLLQPLIAVILPLKLCRLGMSKSLALSELGIIMGMTIPLLSIPSTIIGALCMILIPKINTIKSNQELQKQINIYLKFTLICSFLFIPIFLTLSTHLCNYVYNNLDAGIYMTNSCWIIIPLGISQITTSILNAMSQEQKSFLYYIISNILMIVLIIILPRFTGIQSMLIASGISSILLVFLNLRQLKKVCGLKTRLTKSIIFQTLISIPIIILNTFCYNIFCNYINTFFSIMLTGAISILSHISLLFVFGILDTKVLKEFIYKSNKNKSINI